MTTLKQIDVKQVEKALEKVWTTNKCPFSGHETWTIVEELVELRPYEPDALWIAGNLYPAVMVVCNGCGYIALFSAVALGLLEKGESVGG